MSRLVSIIPLAAGLALVAATAPQALALAQAQGASKNAPSVRYTMTQKVTELSPIVVNGHSLSFPIALQLYKKALTRSWSNDPADLDKLVCRWHKQTGSHMQTLFCETNRVYMKQFAGTQTGLFKAHSEYVEGPRPEAVSKALYRAFENGQIPVVLANFATQRPLSRSTIAPLLKKLPPADASSTLRVTGDNGKPILDYVIKDGNLVHIYHYVYKKAEAAKAKH